VGSSSGEVVLGIDIGGTKCAVVLGTPTGKIQQRIEWPSAAHRGPAAMIAEAVTHARSMLPAVACGVAVGGPLNVRDGVVLSPPHLPRWDQVALRAQLEAALEIPVFVEHDAAACALAEHRWGAHVGCHSLVYLTCGTGIGAGLVIDGAAYHGAGGHSMEIGHMRVADDGPIAFGKAGSLESYCSGTALRLLARWKYDRDWQPHEVAEFANQGDVEALDVLQMHAAATGRCCANLADMLFPDVILLGSLAHYLGASWLDQVVHEFRKEAHPHAVARCQIEPATLGPRVQDLSALVCGLAGL